MKPFNAVAVIHSALMNYINDSAGEGSEESKKIEEAYNTVGGIVHDHEDWAEIHYMVVEAIVEANTNPRWRAISRIARVENGEEGKSSGTGALWELAYDLTNKFYELYKDETWEEKDYHDTFTEFLNEELK